MKHITTALLLAATALGAAAQAPSLKVYKGERRSDTVFTPRQYVIGITDSDASASIDGKEVHVYKTGSFGAEVELKPGWNTYKLEARRGKKSSKAELRLYYDNTERPKAETSLAHTPVNKNVETLPGAYLQYGDGNDRLGGSKMGFLDAGIPLTAIEQAGNLYKVKLGETAFAYIPVEYTREGGQGQATVNTGSASISNAGTTDRISISLPQRLPYSTYTLIDPSSIVLKIYGATNNSNWITQASTPEMVEWVDFRQEQADVLTVEMRLRDKYSWGYSVGYDGTALVVNVRHCPASLELKDLTIGLDAGHGGEYLGAVSPSGLTEKEVNLDIILKAADELRGLGAKVVLTRQGDTGPSMAERKRIWLDAGVDLAVSVHNNSSGNPLKPMGTSAYYKHICNRALASALHDSMLSLGLADFGLTGNFNFSLNGPTEYPNALVEVLFMSSLPEEELLADPDYRSRLAHAVVEGIRSYLHEAATARTTPAK